MKIKSPGYQKQLVSIVMLVMALFILIANPLDAFAQWTTSGANISNSNSGNVGVGTSSPIYTLDVNGPTNAFRAKVPSSSSSDTIATFESGGGIQGIMRANGFFGLGTTSPGAKLAIVSNTQNLITFSVTPDGTNNYYAGNNHDAFLIDGSTTGTHGTYTSGTVRLFRIKAMNGADSMVVGRGGDMSLTPNTGSAGTALKLSVDATNTYYAGHDYDVLYIGGTSLTTHGFYTGKTIRLIHAVNSSGGDAFVLGRDGNASFGGNVTVTGNIAAKYQDVAEWVESSQQLSAGTVVVLDQTKSNQVIASSQSYDTRVAGVISSQPGITLGVNGEGKVLVATTGRVRIKVDASRGSIQVGDLLVTSDVAGVAMKSQPIDVGGVQIHRPGTLVGKALEPLAKGTGEILVLLSLQ
ncbi:MAG TPA: hypothetical protein VGN90_13425 [Pyrinomonadaceae bacterium]|jgi:hypothetical protein|nr:hypothetical protein [Pyrinomonadaceae bacterium]